MCIPLYTGNSHGLGPESSFLMESLLSTGYVYPIFTTLLFTHILAIWISSRTFISGGWGWRWRVRGQKGEKGEMQSLYRPMTQCLWEVSGPQKVSSYGLSLQYGFSCLQNEVVLQSNLDPAHFLPFAQDCVFCLTDKHYFHGLNIRDILHMSQN